MVNFYTDENNQQYYDIEYLQNFIQELAQTSAKRDLSALTVQQRLAIENSPFLLAKYLLEVGKIKEQLEKEEINLTVTAKKREAEEKLKDIIVNVFIQACASEMQMEQVLQLKDNFDLDAKDLNNFRGEPQVNPLTAALAGNRNAADIDALAKEGCNIHFKDHDGNNFAHYGAKYGVEDEVMKYAIDNGVDINAKNNLGKTPVDVAKENGNENTKDFLVENGAMSSLTLEMAAKGRKMAAQGRAMMAPRKPAATVTQTTKTQPINQIPDQNFIEFLEDEFKQDNVKAPTYENYSQQYEDVKDLELQEMALEAPELSKNDLLVLQGIDDFLQHNRTEIAEEPDLLLAEIEKALGFEVDGANINDLLLIAVKSNTSMLATLLLNCGADVNHMSGGKTIFEIAVEKGASSSLLQNMAGRANGKTLEAAANSATQRGNNELATMFRTAGATAERVEEYSTNYTLGRPKTSVQKNEDIARFSAVPLTGRVASH